MIRTRANPKPVREVHADLTDCAARYSGEMTKFVHDKNKNKVDAHISYASLAEAEAALPKLDACLREKGNDVEDSGVGHNANEIGL